MKRLIYIISAISLVLSSCTRENLPGNEEIENCITLKINNSSMDTKATISGTSVENTINTLDFYFYPQGGTEQNSTYYKRVTFEGGIEKTADVHLYITDAEFSSIFPQADQNNCVVYVIANLPEEALPAQDAPTTLQALKQIRIEDEFIDEDGNPVTPSSFVMEGEKTLTRSSNVANSVTGEVDLQRVASKITLRLKLPDYILVPIYDQEGNPLLDDQGQIVNQVWIPEFSSSGPTGGIEDTFVSLHNGVSADYLAGEYTPQSGEYFETAYCGNFTYESSAESYAANSSGAQIHTYTCDLTFYSYSSKWESGDMNAPCFILRIPWKTNDSTTDKYVTHYYQVQINSYGKELASNHWYDLTLNVGVLGSTVATLPMEIQTCSYQVLDWSSIVTVFDREEEDVHLDEWQYLIFDETQVVMNNKTTGTFYFDKSHELAWNLEWPDQDEFKENGYNNLVNGFDDLEKEYNLSTKYASYYLDCTTKNIAPVCLNSGNRNLINNDCFSVDGRTFNFTIPSRIADQSDLEIYTPVYVHVKVWLDIDDDDQLDENEKDYVYHLTFVYYPPMYIVPDSSTAYSVFVNGRTRYNNDDITYRNGNVTYNLSRTSGYSQDNPDACMYVITVTTFSADDTFQWRARQADAYVERSYIIGDPRSRAPMDFATYNMTNNWVKDQIPYNGNNDWNAYNNKNNVENGAGRRLQYYYPTSTDPEAYRIIAPKFRMSSFFGGNSNYCTPEGAVLRCASYQEDGYPAGRWRVPTTAEVQYIIKLQNDGVIMPIFYNNNYYYSATQQIQEKGAVRANSDDNDNQSSVRCVYDEWYWGSEKEAKPNTNFAGDYEFTWGDKFIY